jgi:hypothetical protein
MLLAEDLLLLLTDDGTGKLVKSGTEVDLALGGAQLVELALAERVDLTRKDEGRAGRLVIRDGTPTTDPLLDEALATVTRLAGKKPAAAVGPLAKKVRDRLYDRLVSRGVLRAESGKVLGIFPSRSWPTEDAAHETRLRRLIESAVVHGTTPDPRTAAVVALLHSVSAVPKVVDPKAHGVPRRHVTSRAKEIAEGDWGSAAVRTAISEMTAATTAAITAATTAAVVSGSS